MSRFPAPGCAGRRLLSAVSISRLRRHVSRTTGELRIGLQATFADIQAEVFFLFADPDTHYQLDHQPGYKAGAKYPYENGGCADQLTDIGSTFVGYGHQQQSQKPYRSMHGNSANRIIDLELVQHDDAEHDQCTGH